MRRWITLIAAAIIGCGGEPTAPVEPAAVARPSITLHVDAAFLDAILAPVSGTVVRAAIDASIVAASTGDIAGAHKAIAAARADLRTDAWLNHALAAAAVELVLTSAESELVSH